MLFELGFFVRLLPMMVISFSGLRRHGGSPPRAPRYQQVKPWAYRCVTILYPHDKVASGKGLLALAATWNPERVRAVLSLLDELADALPQLKDVSDEKLEEKQAAAEAVTEVRRRRKEEKEERKRVKDLKGKGKCTDASRKPVERTDSEEGESDAATTGDGDTDGAKAERRSRVNGGGGAHRSNCETRAAEASSSSDVRRQPVSGRPTRKQGAHRAPRLGDDDEGDLQSEDDDGAYARLSSSESDIDDEDEERDDAGDFEDGMAEKLGVMLLGPDMRTV